MPVEPSPEEPSHTPGSDIAGEQAMGWALFIISALLILSLLTSYILRRRKVTVIQEGFVSIAAGMLVGLALRLQPGTEVQNMMNFDADIFFNVLLPPIILSSGYQLHKADFFINLVPIAVFAFIGTFISAMVIGVLLYAFVITGVDSLPISLLDCFIVGSVLSATDPVTVLAVIKQMKVEPRLDAIVSGESLLNDAVAIVLFTTLRMFRGQDFQLAVVGSGVLIFLNVLFSSLAIGIGFALLSALLFKYTDMHLFPSIESCLVLIVAYSSYFFSNGLGKSGIVSLLFCGMTMRHYVTPSLSHHSKITINEVFEIMSRISENFIFVDLGLTLFTDSELIFRPIFIIIAAVIVVISRAAAIFPLSKLMNSIHRKSVEQHKKLVPMSYQMLLLWAGLRGAVAVALAAQAHHSPADGSKPDEKNPGPYIRAMVLGVVVITVVVFGGTTRWLINHAGIRTG
ncbi:Sodium/hydrogen exchanger, partial [Ramicandelaber brevisporus]